MKIENLILFSLAAFLAGCGQQNPASSPSAPQTTKITPPSSAPSMAAPAAPGAPPPPPQAGAIAEAPAPPPGAAGQVAAGDPAATPGADPLFFFRRDEKGQVLGDLEALQQAADGYSRKAGMSEAADQPVWPNLTDLSQLVKVGMLKALPTPPAGKKYVVEPKTHKVTLVNQ